MKDLIDLHTHTTASGHAYSTLSEMIEAAATQGLEVIGISDHSPGLPGSCHEFHFHNFKVIPRNRFGVRLLMGCELNIIDEQGTVDLPEHLLRQLDYTIASIHPPCYSNKTITQNTMAYLGAIKNPHVTIIGHPDDGRFPVDYETIVAAAKEHHTLLEINSSSLHPQSFRDNARSNYIEMLSYCQTYQTPVIISSDAHIDADVGNHQAALSLLKEINFPASLVVNHDLAQLAGFLPKIVTKRWAEDSDD